MTRLLQILLIIFCVNFITFVPMLFISSELGTKKPDAMHTYQVRFRGGKYYYFHPALGFYYKRIGPCIFMGSLGLLFLTGWLAPKIK